LPIIIAAKLFFSEKKNHKSFFKKITTKKFTQKNIQGEGDRFEGGSFKAAS